MRIGLAPFLILTLLGLSPAGLIASAVFATILIAIELRSPRTQRLDTDVLLGAALPLLPAAGPDTMLSCTLLWLIFARRSAHAPLGASWLAPYLSLLAVWCAAQTAFGISKQDMLLLWSGPNAGGLSLLKEVHDWLYYSPPQFVLSIKSALRWFVFAMVYARFQGDEHGRAAFARGLIIGLACAAPLFALQFSELAPQLFVNQSSFWNTIGRWSATFSDPNAFGVFIALTLPLIWEKVKSSDALGRRGAWAVGVFWFLSAPFSGSRSYFVALLIYAFLWAFKRGPRASLALILFGLFLVGAINIASIARPQQFDAAVAKLPNGLTRTVRSIELERLSESLFSRAAFIRVALDIWADNPVLGAGYNTFRQNFPEYASRRSLGTGIWSDNANNFYLGLLAELGLVGALLLMFGAASLRSRPASRAIERAPLICLALLLFLGPHLDFDEISVLSAWLLSRSYVPGAALRLSWGRAVFGLVLGGAVILKCLSSERGLYAWEQSSANQVSRWTASRARVHLNCAYDRARLEISALNPDLPLQPLQVFISSPFEDARLLTFNATDSQTVELMCRPKVSAEWPGLAELAVDIAVSRAWIPRRHGMGNDSRILGVRVVER